MRLGITCYPTHGGSGVIATELGKCLAERGHQIHFITYDMPFRLGKFHQNIYYHGVETSSYAVFKYPPYDLALASRMAQVAKTFDLDLIHVHYAIPHAIAALLARQMVGNKLKVVTTLHGTDITVLGEDPSLKNIISLGITESDAVTAVSTYLARQTKELFPNGKKIERIYNFIDPRIYFPQDLSYLRSTFIYPNQKLLLHISNFRAVKRAQDVVAIFEKVQSKLPVKLLMIGEGPELSKIQSLVYQSGLEDKVIFMGKQDDVTPLLSIADIVLLPSAQESFGLVALEAMACGVPVVASDVGGIPEVVVHDETGFLAPVGSVEKMAEYVKLLLMEEQKYMQMKEAGIKRANRLFAAEDIVTQYEDLYRGLI